MIHDLTGEMRMSKQYNDFITLVKDINNLRAVEGLLSWDQETFMPPRGIEDRSLQLATISSITHEKLTSATMKGYLDELGSTKVRETLTPEQQTNVREVAWEYHRAAAIPADLVIDFAKTRSVASQNWIEARKKSDFTLFYPYLAKLVDMRIRMAEAIGYDDQPYDALLDEFEPGLRTKEVASVFGRLRDKLVPIVSDIIDSGIRPDPSIFGQEYAVEKQKEFNHLVATKLGYDFERGRIDESAHPFTSGTVHDARFTTNYRPDNMSFSLFATIHETGHALYCQGVPEDHYGTPMGEAVSMAIHESQSRMWENVVGRSKEFWTPLYPDLQKQFPSQLGNVGLDAFHGAVNDVHPSLIRVQADEVTYNLHILLRFEMETALMNGELDPKEASTVWNEKMEDYLKIPVPDEAHGVLQDIHWSLGYFGYFPTYALGNLCAAQFFNQAEKDIPELWTHIEQGENHILLSWLRENIHSRGKSLRANDLVKEVTGSALDEDIFIGYLKKKFGALYGI
jgi:carboxypeptidase Taq